MDQAATLVATGDIGYSTEAPASTKVAAGSYHSCAVTAAGGVRCWGANWAGQLGDGTTTGRPLPVAVKGVGGVGALTGVTAVTVGGDHSCALTAAGSVACWGGNVLDITGGYAQADPGPRPGGQQGGGDRRRRRTYLRPPHLRQGRLLGLER
jgi:hypothetical protein